MRKKTTPARKIESVVGDDIDTGVTAVNTECDNQADDGEGVSFIEVTPAVSIDDALPSFVSPVAQVTTATTEESTTPVDTAESSRNVPSTAQDDDVVFEFSMPRTIAPVVERPERAYAEWVDAGVDVVIDDDDDDDDAERSTPGQTIRSRPTPVASALPIPPVPPAPRIVTTTGTVVRSQHIPIRSQSATVTLRPAVPPQVPVTAAVSTQGVNTVVSTTSAVPATQRRVDHSNPRWGQTDSGQLISVRWNKKLKGNYCCWCDKCLAPFTQRNDLKRHLESSCPGVPPAQKVRYMCDHPGCTRDFSTKQYKKEHFHQEHLKVFIYICNSCNKGFYKHVNFHHHKLSCLGHQQQQ